MRSLGSLLVFSYFQESLLNCFRVLQPDPLTSAKSHSSQSVKKQEIRNRITLVILTPRQLKILFLAGVVKFDSWDFDLGYRKV
jgi:hypothetical protein